MTSASVVGHTIKSIVGVKTHYIGDSPLRPFLQDRSLVGILKDVAILFYSRFLRDHYRTVYFGGLRG